MRRVLILLWLCLAPFAALAQDEDKGLITRFLEDSLSGFGREVQIDGFRGALSSRVSMERLTIADADGVWLTLTDAVLDWNRAAVLAGRIEIDTLSASQITLDRWPTGQTGPQAEAGEFALPDLPVSIDIAQIRADQVQIGPAITGGPALLALDGAMTLAEGAGTARLDITRQDGPGGEFALTAGYDNNSHQLAIDLLLQEDPDGLVASLLALPGQPSVRLSLRGDAPIDAYAADLVLDTDGVERLRGRLESRALTDADAALRRISVDLGGDMAPLFLPEYAGFFGPKVALAGTVGFFEDGRIALDQLTLTTAAMDLRGQLALAPSGVPERFDLWATLNAGGDAPLLLPLTGPDTFVQGARLRATFDAAQGSDWTLNGVVSGFERDGTRLDSAVLDASGQITTDSPEQVTGRLMLAAEGLGLSDPALTQALGQQINLQTGFDWVNGAPLNVTDMVLTADGLRLAGSGQVTGLSDDATLSGRFEAEAPDLTRFSALAGRPVAGALRAELLGTYTLLGGAFDLTLNGTGQDLALDLPAVDRNITGPSRLTLSARRDTEGTLLRELLVTSGTSEITAAGMISSTEADLGFAANLADASTVIAGFTGPAELSGRAVLAERAWTVELAAKGPQDSHLTASLSLPPDATPEARFDLSLGDLAWFTPDLSGAATVAGTVLLDPEGWQVEAAASGPGGSRFAVSGTIAPDRSTADLRASGRLPLALANRRLAPNALQGSADVDLRLQGPLGLAALAGTVTTSEATLTLPELRNALTDLTLRADITGRRAALDGSAQITGGGALTVRGMLGLTADSDTTLDLALTKVRLTDQRLYDTTANGALALTGRLPDALRLSGDLTLDQVDIRVPTSNAVTAGEIPPITHTGASTAARQTQTYAGLGPAARQAPATPIALDIAVQAENRIFVRGRGLDAELGGSLHLTGTTADIIPEGRFELVRGRFDILGKRLDLQEGTAQLQGQFEPTLRMVATTETPEHTVNVVLEGPALAPDLRFEATPALPEDEVLAQLLFGRDLTSLTPLQTVQLAQAVATLTGAGGDGLLERLRRTAGVDDLDITASEEGTTTVRVGKYLSEKVYTDVQVDTEGRSVLNLNLDLAPQTSLRGSLTSEGQTGVGLFFERDY